MALEQKKIVEKQKICFSFYL